MIQTNDTDRVARLLPLLLSEDPASVEQGIALAEAIPIPGLLAALFARNPRLASDGWLAVQPHDAEEGAVRLLEWLMREPSFLAVPLAAAGGRLCLPAEGASFPPLPGIKSLQACTSSGALAHLRSLESLTLGGVEGDDLSGLSGLLRLSSLVVHCCPTADLTALSGLTALRRLALPWSSALERLSGIEALTQLTSLSMREADISDLGPLSGLAGLRHLVLCRHVGHADLRPLAGLELSRLWVGGQSSGASALAEMPLRTLKLSSHELRSSAVLGTLPRLERLALESDSLTELDGLSACRSLRVLKLKCPALTDLSGLANHPTLEVLTLFRPEALETLGALGTLPRLRTVEIFGGDVLRDISALQGMPALRKLRLQDLPALTSLAAGPALETLHCAQIPSVRSLAPLRGLARLRALTLRGATRVADLEPLRMLPALEVLELGTPMVRSLSPLSGLPALRELQLGSYGISPVPELVFPCCTASALPPLPRLEKLDLNFWQTLRSLDSLRGSPRLSSLSMGRLGRLSDIRALWDLPSLRSMSFSECPEIPLDQRLAARRRWS